jgi:hypothetical protein
MEPAKNNFQLTCIAAAAFASTATANVPSDNHTAVYLNMTSYTVAASPNSTINAFKRFRGDYLLDDGSMLSISRHGRRVFANISVRSRVEVRATAVNTLASPDSDTTITFKQKPNGVISQVVMTQSPAVAAAKN